MITGPWSLGLRGLEYWVGLRRGWIGLEEGREEECEIQTDVSEKLEVSLKSSGYEAYLSIMRCCDLDTLFRNARCDSRRVDLAPKHICKRLDLLFCPCYEACSSAYTQGRNGS